VLCVRWYLSFKLSYRDLGLHCENRWSAAGRVNVADHSLKSVQMAPLSGRHYPVVRALVPAISDLIRADNGDGSRTRIGNDSQLNLAVGSGLWSGNRWALPAAFEAHKPKLEVG
jgi:hypothetical protein